jgi:hypothetical protein
MDLEFVNVLFESSNYKLNLIQVNVLTIQENEM